MDVNLLKINPNFTQEALDEIPYWLKDKDNWNKFIKIYADRWAALDEVTVKVAYGRLLAVAVGKQLDDIGAKFGVTRGDMTDTQFRSFIGLRMYQATANGSRPNISQIIELLTGFTPRISKSQNYLVQVIVSPICLDKSSLGEQLEALFPVMTNLEVQTCEKTPFGFTSSKSPDTFGKEMKGFSASNHRYTGGAMTSVNYTSRNGSNYTTE